MNWIKEQFSLMGRFLGGGFRRTLVMCAVGLALAAVAGFGIGVMLPQRAAQVLGDTVRTADYALPGTQELADNCVKALGDKAMACLLKSHGAVCLGKDLEQAFGNSTVLEATAQVYSIIRSMGGQFQPISPENIAFMQEFVKTSYGQR